MQYTHRDCAVPVGFFILNDVDLFVVFRYNIPWLIGIYGGNSMILLMKRIMVLALAIFAFFTNGTGKGNTDYCVDYDFPRMAEEKQAPCTLRIMSFNIRYAGVNGNSVTDRITIGECQILEIMPDSFGLQEATNVWMVALDERLTMYDWVGIERENGGSPTNGGESCPIFYLRSKFKLLDSGNFWLSETPDVPSVGPGAECKRICTWAKLKNRKTGEVYVHVNTHFDHVSEEARVQGALIVNRFIEENFSDVPVVFTADMNTSDKGEAYATMTKDLTDTRLAAKDCVSYGTFHGGQDPSLKADYYIDFVLCSDNFDVAAYRTVTKGFNNRFTSDHFPIYADLKLRNG